MNAKVLLGRFALTILLFAFPGSLLAQFIDDFNPKYGQVGENVDINGSGFNTAPGKIVVKFNGVVASNVYVVSSYLIHVKVPTGATSGTITVQNSGGPVVHTFQPFTVIGPGPYISSFDRTNGGPGTLVGINGVHFSKGVTAVKFNGVSANFRVVSDIYLEATVPASATSGPITVVGPSGSSTSAQNFYLPPVIVSVSPAVGRTGTSVKIAGTNFVDATAVKFGSLSTLLFTVDNPNQITAIAPTNVASGSITVVTPGGIYERTNAFKVLPTLSGFSPDHGAEAASITLFGANLNAGTPKVWFNGVEAAQPTGVSFSQLTAKVPVGASTGLISIKTADGNDTNSTLFYLPVAITNISANSGTPGRQILISGRNFVGATNVAFNGLPASFFVTNNTVIGAIVPTNFTTGPITVATPYYSAVSTPLFYGPPVIDGFSPSRGVGGTNVTITGTNFAVATTVRLNNQSVPFGITNNQKIVFTVPNNAQTGPITVESPSGIFTTTTNFVVDRPSNLETWGSASPATATVGSNLTYTITIVNHGPNAAPNTRFTNFLDDSVILKSASINQGTLITNGNSIIANLGYLTSGSAPTFTLTVVPQQVGAITNYMSVGSDNPDSSPYNNTAEVSTWVQSLPKLSIKLAPNDLLRVSWPVDLTNFVLQSRSVLQTNYFGTNVNWSNVTGEPGVSGNQRYLTLPNAGA
ncbi:MAG TPA: IPT/TIG domain-containing protein, partial [Clostridia bacterium]|nr:IPT/TIG domain-containing protein [Clostridia bacterium]